MTEPVLTANGLIALVTAILTLGTVMGWWTLSEEQSAAWMAVVGLLLPLLFGVWARGRVTPVAAPKAENVHGDLVPLVPADGSKLPPKV